MKVIRGVKESDRCDLFLSHLFLPSFFLALKGKGKERHGDQEGVSWPLSSRKQLHHPYWGKALSKTVLLKLRVSINCTGKEKRTVKSPSCVRLFATPWTVAYRAPPPMGFSRKGYWSGLPFSTPGESSRPRNQTWVSHITGRRFTV